MRLPAWWWVCLVLLPLGCTMVFQVPLNAPNEPLYLLDPLALKNLKMRYEARLSPNDAAPISNTLDEKNFLGLGGRKATMQFHFTGVRQSEEIVEDVLSSMRVEVMNKVRDSGAEVRGEVRSTQNKGGLKRYEFDYVKGKVTGQVYLEAKPGAKSNTWDVDCMVWETFR